MRVRRPCYPFVAAWGLLSLSCSDGAQAGGSGGESASGGGVGVSGPTQDPASGAVSGAGLSGTPGVGGGGLGGREGSGSDVGPALAFVGAEGFGRFSKGGRGGALYLVTDLADSRAGKQVKPGVFEGTLRYACEAEGPRTIVFRKGGTITLDEALGPIRVENSHVTMAGQTAPGDGVMVRMPTGIDGGEIMEVRTTDVVIRHLRFRRGPGGNGDALSVGAGSERVIIDHCSMSWSTDETMSVYGNQTPSSVKDVTVQRSILCEPLDMSTHEYGGSHGRGPLVGGGATQVSFFANFFCHSDYRMPQFATVKGSFATGTSMAVFQVVNNVVYNWRRSATQWGNFIGEDNPAASTQIELTANYYRPGPDSGQQGHRELVTFVGGKETRAYVENNIIEGEQSNPIGDWPVGMWGSWDIAPESLYRANAPIESPHIRSRIPVTEVLDHVLASAGAIVPARDVVDSRVVDDARNKTGYLIDCVTTNPSESPISDCARNAGGWPTYEDGEPYPDTDLDGMDDRWEQSVFGGLLTSGSSDADLDGYTNLEEFLGELAGD